MNPREVETAEHLPRLPSHNEMVRAESALAQVDVSGLSHIGKVRKRNEDHFLVARFGRFLERLQTNVTADEAEDRFSEVGYGLVVADGLGGHAAGDTASELAINILLKLVRETSDWVLRFDSPRDIERVIERTKDRFAETSRSMTEESKANPQLRGFGTTLTLASSVGKHLFLAHVGDSRAYLLRRGELHQLTTDHTCAQELFDAGVFHDPNEGAAWLRSSLTRLLGDSVRNTQPHVQTLRLESGDTLLVSSDGLTDMVDDPTIARVLAEGQNAESACARLVDLALEAGGRDNVTLIVARYEFPQ